MKIRFIPHNCNNQRQFLKQKKHWHLFYLKFTDYLYDDLGHFDNYVGSNIKLLKSFCHWIEVEKGINTGSFYKSFHVAKEEIPIIVLQPEQLNFLIYNKALDTALPKSLKNTKDFFVFGCTVGLRVSDIKALKKSNLEILDDTWYLKVHSKKTKTLTKIKLPPYAINIIKRNQNRSSFLFPAKTIVNFLC